MKPKFTIRVSATSANIGSAFDTAGIALNLYNSFTFDFNSNQLVVTGNKPFYNNENHLALKTFFFILEKYNISKPAHLKLSCFCEIPDARGLGSSSTCIVAGVIAANHYGKLNLSQEQLLLEAVLLEGHPDNVAPAMLGQLVASLVTSSKVFTQQIPPHTSLRFIAIVPDEPLETKSARQTLKKSYDLEEITFNLSRASLLMDAFSRNDIELIKVVTQDKLHQSYRIPLIKDFDIIEEQLKKEPVITHWISGSGSTVMALIDQKDESHYLAMLKHSLPDTFQIYALEVEEHGSYLIDELNHS